MSGDVERVAAALEFHMSERDFEQGCAFACGYDGDDRAAHLAQALLLAPGGVVAGMVAEAREAGIEEGVDSTWHLKRLRAMWHEDGAAEVRARVEAVADWLAAQEADVHDVADEYAEGARDAYDAAETRLRAALAEEPAETGQKPAQDGLKGCREGDSTSQSPQNGSQGDSEGCDCVELCDMGPTCPGGMLARLPGSGCWRSDERGSE
jgi:hypothetical protein